MIDQEVIELIQKMHKTGISTLAPVGGGSINHAYKYSVGEDSYFVKFNTKPEGIIRYDVEGLRKIKETNTISCPEIIAFEIVDELEVLILRYITEGVPTPSFWERFGRKLADMHQQQAPFYGWMHDNYIGSLPQSNKQTSDFKEFFISQRIQPQVSRAYNSGFLSNNDLALFDDLYNSLGNLLPETQPSLVHGDLWSGNFIIGEQNEPFLIDPAIHYNFRETDLAFTHLFGGFDSLFYESYQNSFPLAPQFIDRISLYNLYPLLVHLNLFGSSYYGSVKSALQKYV